MKSVSKKASMKVKAIIERKNNKSFLCKISGHQFKVYQTETLNIFLAAPASALCVAVRHQERADVSHWQDDRLVSPRPHSTSHPQQTPSLYSITHEQDSGKTRAEVCRKIPSVL